MLRFAQKHKRSRERSPILNLSTFHVRMLRHLYIPVSLTREPHSRQCITKRCRTLSGHNVVEGKDFKRVRLISDDS